MRNVIVTGGTGALGSAVVGAFLDGGDRVIVPWVAPGELDRLLESLGESERLVAIEADISEELGAQKVVQEAGRVDVLVNGVGAFAGGPPLAEAPLEDWDRMYRINLRTAVAMSRAALPSLASSTRGALLFVASSAVDSAPAGLGAYVASKAGVVALARTLVHELASTSVRVNTIVPTTIDTPANRAAMPDADFSSWTPPAEIARVLHWLASEDAGTVRGAFVPV